MTLLVSRNDFLVRDKLHDEVSNVLSDLSICDELLTRLSNVLSDLSIGDELPDEVIQCTF